MNKYDLPPTPPCPLCGWTHTPKPMDPRLTHDTLAGVFGPGVVLLNAQNEQRADAESALNEHFKGHTVVEWIEKVRTLEAQVMFMLQAEHRAAELEALLNTPEIKDFLDGVRLEAAHQRQRWGAAHDREKSAEHWFWLVGYLAGKANRSHIEGDLNKARHHTISSAAALFHWHDAISKDASGHGVGRDADLEAHDNGRQAHETAPI